MAWRETRAVELIGPYAVKTAGGFMNSANHIVVDGWLYAGRDAMCFFADDPTMLNAVAPPGMVDSRTLVISYQDCAEPVITAPGAAPNAILHFGGTKEFVGTSARMLEVARMWFMSAAGGLGGDTDWEARYNGVGAPLHARGWGLSRRIKNAVSLIIAVSISMYVLGVQASRGQDSIIEIITFTVGAFVTTAIVARSILTLIPRYGKGQR
jgi:hypothetical protein